MTTTRPTIDEILLPFFAAQANGKKGRRITEQLAWYLVRRRLIDRSSLACPLIDIEIAIERGREQVRRQQREAKAPF